MRLFLIAALLASVAPTAVSAHEATPAAAPSGPVPKEQLLTPPADAVKYVVVSEAGQHGTQWRWQLPDGRTAYRWSQELRGWITEMDQVTRFAPGGTIEALTVRGVTLSGDAAEEYRVANGRATWKTATDSGEAAAGGWYIPAGGIGIANAPLIDALAAAGDAGIDFLPSGKGRMRFGPTQVIEGAGGPKTVQLAFISGILPSPLPVWLDENKRYFADISFISVIRRDMKGRCGSFAMRRKRRRPTRSLVSPGAFSRPLPRPRCCSTMCSCSTPTRASFCPAARCWRAMARSPPSVRPDR